MASDVVGVSGQAILRALIGGQTDPHELARLARGRLRSKMSELEVALGGYLQAHHALILSELLSICWTRPLTFPSMRRCATRRHSGTGIVAWNDSAVPLN